MIIRHNSVLMDPVKVKGILEWPTPTSVKQVRGFLGFGNFYRRFIDHYSDLAKPLNDLTKKNQAFDWTQTCQDAFDTLKQKFTSAPVLIMPDTTKPFLIESDASLYATGAVLRQQDLNGDWHPVAYLSQSLNTAERNYEIYDRELLGIIRALEAWRHYIEGSPHPTKILTDHKNLTYFRSPQRLNRRQARWSLFLSRFNYQLEHCAGTKMVQSDAITRASQPDDVKEDNADQTVLADEVFSRPIIEEIHHVEIQVPSQDDDLRREISQRQQQDTIVTEVRRALQADGTFPLKSSKDDWNDDDGIMFYKSRCYIPYNDPLRRRILQRYHDSKTAEHPGQYKTLELLRRDYFWPSMASYVNNYVKGCALCQQMKVNHHPTTPPLTPIKPTHRD